MTVRPEYIDAKDWFASLIVDYPKESLPVLETEDNWREVGAVISGTGIFARIGVPSPFIISEGRKINNFATWDEWAKVVYMLLINASAKRQL